MNNIIECSNLKKSFHINKTDYEPVLKGIDFTVSTGEFVSIVGPSGSGKSTFLYCLSGLMKADSGKSTLFSVDLIQSSRKKRSEIRRRNASFIFQDYNLVDSMTAWENVQLALKFISKRRSRRELNELFSEFGLSHRKNYYPAQLSGGQRQRVAIIRAIAVKPRVLFADEPTGALDSNSGRLVIDKITELNNQGTSVVMVTHDLDVASKAHRSVVLRDGRLTNDIKDPSIERLFDAIGDYK